MEEELQDTDTSSAGRTKGYIPSADMDLLTIGKGVVASWKKHPELTLTWVTSARMEQVLEEYELTLMSRKSEGSLRPEKTQALKNLDRKIDKCLEYLKGYLKEIYADDAIAHFSQYGILKIGTSYKLPLDRDFRVSALDLVVDAIVRDNLQNRIYGLQFWTEIREQYRTLKNDANVLDENVADKVSRKNILRNEIRKILSSLVHLIKANNPKTYKSELRVWGFQKEKY